MLELHQHPLRFNKLQTLPREYKLGDFIARGILQTNIATKMQHNVNYTKGGMIGLSIAFMVLPIAFMCLRAWAKLIAKRFASDDYLAFGALVSYHAVGLRS